MRILALPGDEETVLRFLINESLKRERRMTGKELMAYDYGTRCALARERAAEHGGVWRCTYEHPCTFCCWVRSF